MSVWLEDGDGDIINIDNVDCICAKMLRDYLGAPEGYGVAALFFAGAKELRLSPLDNDSERAVRAVENIRRGIAQGTSLIAFAEWGKDYFNEEGGEER